jgi:hypothetical protein
MSTMYSATATAICITALLAANLLRIGLHAQATPGLLAALLFRARRMARRLKRFIDARVAAMIARREHQAATYAARRVACRKRSPHAEAGRWR